MSPERSATRKLIRLLIVVLLLLGAVPLAAADPRLVRLIWDVGNSTIYVRAYPRTAIGADSFRVPKDGTAALREEFQVLRAGEQLLRKGDRVRMYVVNYNPVSHVWHDTSTFEAVAETPSLVGPILNALVLAVTGVGKIPTSNLNPLMISADFPTVAGVPCPVPAPVRTALDALRKTTTELAGQADRVLAEARTAKLNEAARRLANIPTDPELWAIFDNREAWQKISPLNFEDIAEKVGGAVKDLDGKVEAANAATIAFDLAFNDNPMPAACRNEARNVALQRENAVAIVREVAGDGAPARVVAAKLQTAETSWSTYKRKLQYTNWTAEAIEVPLKDAVAADVVLRMDAVFASPDKNVTERTQRSIVLGVQPFVPVFVITGGIAGNWFDFKTLKIEKAAVSADGALTVKDRLVIADADSWSRLAPVWLENIRILRLRRAGIYGTFGTTPDRNIFKNIIYGGSIGVPRWRTFFTLGRIRATGYTEDDLRSTQQAFTDPQGFSSKDLTMTNLPLAKAPWHATWFVSAAFVLASF